MVGEGVEKTVDAGALAADALCVEYERSLLSAWLHLKASSSSSSSSGSLSGRARTDGNNEVGESSSNKINPVFLFLLGLDIPPFLALASSSTSQSNESSKTSAAAGKGKEG